MKRSDSPNAMSTIRAALSGATVVCLLAVVLLSVPRGASAAPQLDVAADWMDGGNLCVTFVPHPPAHLSDGFEVRLPDGTELVAVDKPQPDEGEPFPSYSSPFSVRYLVPDGSGGLDSVLVTCQSCEGEMCYLPETRSVRIGGGGALPPPAEGPVDAVAPASEAAVAERYRTAGVLDGYAAADEFLRFLADSRGSESDAEGTTGGGWRVFLANPRAFLMKQGWILTILAILLGGFLLNLTPCVLPMIPVNLAIIGAAASSGAPRRVRFGLGLAYGAGMAAAYGGLGAAVVRAGGVFGAGLNASPWFAAAMAVLFAALGLAMFGTWNLDFSRWRRASRVAGRARFPAAFLAGGLSALLAGACVAPVLVAVLALAGGLYAEGRTGALLLPFLLGLGMALPWPMAAAGFAVLPKPGAWMERVKKVFGVLILALAAWYAWSAAARFAATRTETDGHRAPPGFEVVDFAEPDAPARLDALLAEAADAGRPVLLDFGARWCKVCALMEATTLRDARVTAALDGFLAVAILADDPSAPSVAPLLARHGVHGYPAYRLLLAE